MDSVDDIPKEILKQVNELEKFFLTKETMNHIVANFIKQMDKGLSKEGGSIPMLPTWVLGCPEGNERGTYLALDIGGTNFRLCKVDLYGEGKFNLTQSNYSIPKELKHSDADHFFGFIAICLKNFLKEHNIEKDISLGFTFSFPCKQDKIDHGILKQWTKEFNVKNVVNYNVVDLLVKAIEKESIPVNVVALVNDTAGTLIASNYSDSQTMIAVIFGTGSNASYMEHVKYIPKIDHLNLPPDLLIAINCEWGAFDNEQIVLPRTKYDIIVDRESNHPQQQTFEKMVSGFYLGEIMRQILLDLYNQGFLFKGQCFKLLEKSYSFQTPYLDLIEHDTQENLIEIYNLFETQFSIKSTLYERKLVRALAKLIMKRSAYLSACGIAAIFIKKKLEKCSVGVDGSIINKYSGYKEHVCDALKHILGPNSDKITLIPAQDGSGVGAAIIAAMTLKRKNQGKFIHI